MARLVSASLLCALLAALVGAAPALWPQPATWTNGATTLAVAHSWGFFSVEKPSLLLSDAFARYLDLTFTHLSASVPKGVRNAVLSGLHVTVDDLSEDVPQLGVDESYSLEVPAAGGTAQVHAKTVFGALRGLETFSQLVKFDFDEEAYYLEAAPWKIDDRPRFPHRGLMIDTGRHFLPLEIIREVIDSLPYAKLNVLHWHAVDQQSFAVQSHTHPKLWEGAFSRAERYTQADIASIVEYARLRGVRVIVEFDMPGHAHSWCAGYPEICPSPSCLSPLNVASNATFDLIDALLGELTGRKASAPGAPSGLFPDNFIHLGGDEVDTTCWLRTPSIAAWLNDHKMSASQGYAFFVKKAVAMAIQQGRRPIQWSEVFDMFKTELDKKVIVHVWKEVTNVTEHVDLGYNVIRNVGYHNESWYFDNLDIISRAVYHNDPCKGIPTEELCSRVLGGHGEMWGETVDGSDLEQTVWPKLAAVAEKLWSPRQETQDWQAAEPRITSFRCLLLDRGVKAAPVDNAVARGGPKQPGPCEVLKVARPGVMLRPRWERTYIHRHTVHT
mmetsp:Transcript_33045/g.84405  ORF Transcript_33045/g.84405 Transcript_33045/m.84405 type:complete len:556 (-) Transcript_33045:232-1899(-)